MLELINTNGFNVVIGEDIKLTSAVAVRLAELVQQSGRGVVVGKDLTLVGNVFCSIRIVKACLSEPLRGSSYLAGMADVILTVCRDGDQVTLKRLQIGLGLSYVKKVVWRNARRRHHQGTDKAA